MSTKTTFKRIALVAVAALGFGVLTAVAPASAAHTTGLNVTSISVSTDVAPVAGTVASLHRFTFQTDSTTAGIINPYVRLVSKPSNSTMSQATTAVGSELAVGGWRLVNSSGATAPAQTSRNSSILTNAQLVTNGNDLDLSSTGAANVLTSTSAVGNYAGRVWVNASYDKPGTYVWSVFDDAGGSAGLLDATDYGQTFTVVVSDSSINTTAKAAFSAIAGSSSTTTYDATKSPYGALIRLTLTDAAGNAIVPDQGSAVTISVNGSAKIDRINNSAAGVLGTGVSSYSLSAANFNGSGRAWINVIDAAAETVTLTATSNSFSAFTTASIAVTFTAATTPSASLTVVATATGSGLSSSSTYPYTGGTVTVQNGQTTTTTSDAFNVTDTNGVISGRGSASVWTSAPAAGVATTGATYSISAPALASASVSGSYTINSSGGTALTVTPGAAGTALTLTSTNGTLLRYATAATVSIPFTIKDNFGAALAGATIATTVAGRNAGRVVTNVISSSTGTGTVTFTDASTSTTSLQDVVTLTSGSATTTVTINYSTVAALGVSKVWVSTPSTTAYSTTATPVTRVPAVFSNIYAGDGAETGKVDVVATVLDANNVPIAGVPVSFTVAGTGVAITSTTATKFTNAAGQATANVYAWTAGTYTVTATAGGVAGTAVTSWESDASVANYARTLTLTEKDGTITASVKDRFGNPVKGAVLVATRVGTGNFGGASSIQGTTSSAGTVDFILSNGSGEVTVSFATTGVGQTAAGKGLISSQIATDKFTAYTAGTTSTDEDGVGSTFDAAGNGSATISTSGSNAAADNAQAATDAAAEATDAANAATDAANAAAEAADAATAAAQDAADAVAALSTQVSEMINSLKKQITALTNLVIKIQKKVKA